MAATAFQYQDAEEKGLVSVTRMVPLDAPDEALRTFSPLRVRRGRRPDLAR